MTKEKCIDILVSFTDEYCKDECGYFEKPNSIAIDIAKTYIELYYNSIIEIDADVQGGIIMYVGLSYAQRPLCINILNTGEVNICEY